jgi:hypothetical protein
VDWIGLAQDKNRWRALVNSVLNLRVPWHAGKLSSGLTSSGLSGSAQLHRVSKLVAFALLAEESWVCWLCSSSAILNNYKTQRYRNWICVRLQVMGRRHSIGCLRKSYPGGLDWRLTLSKRPNGVFVSLPSPEDVHRSSFRNDAFLPLVI